MDFNSFHPYGRDVFSKNPASLDHPDEQDDDRDH